MEKAFKMKLKPGYEAEYKKRHDAIWPELKQAIGSSGVYDYSIYFDSETLTLFAVQKIKDGSNPDEQKDMPIVRKWWDMMADIMEVNPDNSPVCTDLPCMFHMD
ncbi:L-rhamnose mutarotase [Treponema sp. HNW]|uniref:L-rhamnose mutarotase n=1 Tax=Treponema sp. HNW TaxID=3116654 RepID=UPI003D09D448